LNWPETADRLAEKRKGAQSIELRGEYAMKIVLRISAILFYTIAIASVCAEQRGANVYKTSCAQCHGATGEADTPAAKIFNAQSLKSPDVLKMSDAEMVALIKKGKGKMPAWEEILTDDQLKNVIEYIHTLQKSKNETGSSATDPAATGSGKQ
jgi:mono/diheme cytochrome c family protein